MPDLPPEAPRKATVWQHDPLAPLLDDHAMARAVLAAMEQGARCEWVGRPVNMALWHRVLAFFDDYFDGVHHPKEDELLLPLLASQGFVTPGSAAQRMLQEHERMAPLLRELRHVIEQRPPNELRAGVQEFVKLHRQHMALEELHVFPMARAVLGAATQHELLAALQELDRGPAAASREHARTTVLSILAIAAHPDT